jgi:hypothetical protein
MFSPELLIAIARERHADRLQMAEQARVANRIAPARVRAVRLPRLRAFVLAPARRREA